MIGSRRFAVLFTAPLTVALLALLIYPLVSTVLLALRSPEGTFGVANFAAVFTQPGFVQVLGNTAVFTLASTVLSLVLGFSMAYAMDFIEVGRRWLVSLFMLPLAIMPVVSGLTFGMMLNPALGVVNQTLLMLGIAGPGWATDTTTALLTVVLIDVWQWTPFCFLVFLAALQGMPDELFEAARIDGASALDLLTRVILPLLQPTILIVLLLRLAEALKLFDVPFALTGGGPGIATQSYSFLAFRVGLRYFDLGYASAMAYVLLIVVMIIVTLFFRRLRESYG